MKSAFLLICILVLSAYHTSQAQTPAEWFSQKKTQKKYLLAQIVLLQRYIGWLKDGYKIVDGGLTTIRKIKNHDLNLHTVFLTGLKKVNPAIGKNHRVAEIAATQIALLIYCNNIRRRLREQSAIPSPQLNVIDQHYAGFTSEVATQALSLVDVITDGSLEMNDAARLKKIDEIYGDLQATAATIQQTSTQLLAYGKRRVHQENEIKNFQKLY